ncbi:hypothetical protein [Vibrio harveyi]|uniref:hypothetical protein n=1 Tax=Vibrio harveyi TaxID=669 RepID=UPI00247FC8B5|nr:hypothetical protein [Vibrio harveyi]
MMANESNLTKEEIAFLNSLDDFVLSDAYISFDVLNEEEARRLRVVAEDGNDSNEGVQ